MTTSRTLTFGSRIEIAGHTWELVDTRHHDQCFGEPRGDLCPVDPVTGERIMTVRIGRAERSHVRISVRADRSGQLAVYPTSQSHAAPLTANQRAILTDAVADVEFDLPPMTNQEILARLEREISGRAGYQASRVLQHDTRTALREAMSTLDGDERTEQRRRIIDAACAAFLERLVSEVGSP